MFNTLSFEGNNQREIHEFEENVQNSISKTTNRCWEHRNSKVRGISFNPFKENTKEIINGCPSLETKFAIKRWENDGKKTNRKMEIRKNERKEDLQGLKHRVYGMDGVGKQTDSISFSIKRCVIKRMVDGKGIWIS